jgi:coenzyme F420-reducing hydrogenase delta subunit
LPERSLRDLRDRVGTATAALTGPARVVVFGCDHAVPVERLGGRSVAYLSLPCIAALPPAFIDYVLSRRLAEGVLLTGCRKGECYNRFGIEWTEARLAGTRDPNLRRRVPRERIAHYWAAAKDRKGLETAIAEFQAALADLPDEQTITSAAPPGPPPGPRTEPQGAKIDA